MKRNPLLTAEYYRALRAFHKQHRGAIPRVIQPGSINTEMELRDKQQQKAERKLRRSQGRSAPAANWGGKPNRRNDEPSNGSGVGRERPSGNSPSDGDGAMMSRAPEALPMRVDGDR